ncbi:MAG: GNAT family N-acetyltransferase [Propionibacteriaceae bacterium]|jgi:GNAT superfamily N-acetyltransferase|nr:GNAT family N-acetyltransferase [Propionibacteriaceae bacterium]
MTTLRASALAALDDPVFFADMIASIARGAEIVASDTDGVVLLTSDGTILLASHDAEATSRQLDLVDQLRLDQPYIVTHNDDSKAVVANRYNYSWLTPCWSAAFLGESFPAKPTDIDIRQLADDQIDEVITTYDLNGPDYIRQRFADKAMFGAWREDQLLGYIGTHAQGAMGLLYVFPSFRHQGVAEALVCDLGNRLLAAGHRPYDHIVVGNDASDHLQRKLGFTISTRQLCWLSAGR